MSEKLENKIENEQIEERKAKVYYLQHVDGFGRLSPVFLINNKKIWKLGVKERSNGTKMYYIFYSDKSYLKLWLDKKKNLLYFIDGYYWDFLMKNKPEIWKFIPICAEFKWNNNSIEFKNVKIEFEYPIFSAVTQLHPSLDMPTAYVIYKLYNNNS